MTMTNAERLAVLETKVDDVQETLRKIDKKLDAMETIYVKRFEFATLQKVVYASLGVIITTMVGILATILL